MDLLALITIVSLTFPFSVAIYTFFRKKMVKATHRNMGIDFYSRLRVVKITLAYMLGLFSALLFAYSCIYLILHDNRFYGFYSKDLIIFILILIVSFVIAYGGGIYISAIITEEYTLSKLKKYKEYSVLDVQIQLYHGPISHLFIFAGAIYLMLLIATLEFSNPTLDYSGNELILFAIDGIIIGASFFAAQIINLTWKHQLGFALPAVVIYSYFLHRGFVDFELMPFNIFFFFFLITLCFGLLLTYIHHKIYRTQYVYDEKIKISKSLFWKKHRKKPL